MQQIWLSTSYTQLTGTGKDVRLVYLFEGDWDQKLQLSPFVRHHFRHASNVFASSSIL